MLGGGVAIVALVALVAGVADVAGMVGVLGVVGMAAETGRSETQKGMLRLSRGSEAAWLNAGPTLKGKPCRHYAWETNTIEELRRVKKRHFVKGVPR